MSLAGTSQSQILHFPPGTDRVILIAGGWQNLKLAENLREEIQHSGWDCEIFQGDITDSIHAGKLVHDVLDCCYHVNLLVNNGGTTRDRSIRKMTDEEWLAQ
jgi:short-subunit dehydrogenase